MECMNLPRYLKLNDNLRFKECFCNRWIFQYSIHNKVLIHLQSFSLNLFTRIQIWMMNVSSNGWRLYHLCISSVYTITIQQTIVRFQDLTSMREYRKVPWIQTYSVGSSNPKILSNVITISLLFEIIIEQIFC